MQKMKTGGRSWDLMSYLILLRKVEVPVNIPLTGEILLRNGRKLIFYA